MSSSIQQFSDSFPKRSDVIGSCEQVFGCGTVLHTTIVNSIKAGTVAAVGFVSGSLETQFIYNPQVHTKLDGTPTSILGNASNVIGEFTLVSLSLESVFLFPYIIRKEEHHALSPGRDIPKELLAVTTWYEDDDDTFVWTAVPNIFLIYFGQDIPLGRISLDSTKTAFTNLGPGYALWINLANGAIEDEEDVQKIIDSGTGEGTDGTFLSFVNRYFHSDCDKYGVKVRRVGPTTMLSLPQSNLYPTISDTIKKNFGLSLTSPQGGFNQATATVIVQHPSEMGKKAEAAKGQQKLLLMMLCGDIDLATGAITNIIPAEPSKSLQIVLNCDRLGQPQSLSDVFRKGFSTAKKYNASDIRSKELSLKNISKATSGHILLGNFSTNSITSLFNEPNSIDISAFFPQNDNAIKVDQQSNLMSRMEEGMDVPDGQRSKVVSTIKRVGKVTSMKDLTSLLININTVIMIVTSSECPKPLLYQVFAKIITLTIDNNWDDWMIQCGGSIPNVHLLLLSYIDRIFICFATFCTDINNINVVTENRPLDKLDASELGKASTVLLALLEDFRKAQAQGVPVNVPQQVVARFSTSGGTPSAPPTKPVVTPSASSQQKREDKRFPATPEKGEQSKQGGPAKKPKRSTTTAGGYIKKDMGMFYPKNPDSKHPNIFPAGIKDRICVDFTCKGLECLGNPCPLKHPRRAKDIDSEDVEAIAAHFKMHSSGHLSAYHFAAAGLSAEALLMMGDHTGIVNTGSSR
jgi:hypothetical protein